jgi:hypothetical protein
MSLKYIFKNAIKSNKYKYIKNELDLFPIKNTTYFNHSNFDIKNNNYLNNLFSKENNSINNNISINDSNSVKNKELDINLSKSIISKNNSSLINQPLPLNIKIIKKNNKNEYVKLNSLFTLPIINKTISRYDSNKTIYSQKNLFLTDANKNIIRNKSKLRLNLFNNNISMNRNNKDKKYNNLYSFMKLKYYEDINEKLEKKLRDDSFIDRGVKDKIIKMGKVGVFWKNVIEYCSPLLFEEKYKNVKKILNNNCSYDEKSKKKSNGFDKILYTSVLRNKIIHYQNRNKKNLFI